MITQALKRARELLAKNGWVGPAHEPFCVAKREDTDLNGKPQVIVRLCWEWDEGLTRYSLHGALFEAGAWPEGWHLLEQVVAPTWAAVRAFSAPEPFTVQAARQFHALCQAAAGKPTLEEWLDVEGRKDGELLTALAEAIARSKKRTGERRG